MYFREERIVDVYYFVGVVFALEPCIVTTTRSSTLVTHSEYSLQEGDNNYILVEAIFGISWVNVCDKVLKSAVNVCDKVLKNAIHQSHNPPTRH